MVVSAFLASSGSPALVAGGAVITGAGGGFLIGRRHGRRWFRPDVRILKSAYLDETDAFFPRRGTP
ncbi:hypothetical protein [Microbacterium elymi]|uniref:Transmembrane protein n=1 Tax=Microbacterium elymi TaxID=2909587 RepID=A0ABY5NME5_9MICO|nr:MULTISPECIES: hypothetical protein [Microbacterium]UUT36345.1 hypothetical protein L2X98_25735 [Microbacterium elymi]